MINPSQYLVNSKYRILHVEKNVDRSFNRLMSMISCSFCMTSIYSVRFPQIYSLSHLRSGSPQYFKRSVSFQNKLLLDFNLKNEFWCWVRPFLEARKKILIIIGRYLWTIAIISYIFAFVFINAFYN